MLYVVTVEHYLYKTHEGFKFAQILTAGGCALGVLLTLLDYKVCLIYASVQSSVAYFRALDARRVYGSASRAGAILELLRKYIHMFV